MYFKVSARTSSIVRIRNNTKLRNKREFNRLHPWIVERQGKLWDLYARREQWN